MTGPYVRSFNSMEEMFDFMARATESANAHLADEQKALTWGSYWFRPFDDFVIFGYVFTQEEFEARERWSYHRGGALDEEEEAEFGFSKAHVLDAHERGYLFGEAFSVSEPSGELGDTHRANAWPITAEQFEAAKAAHWNHMDPTVVAWLRPLVEKIRSGGR